MDIEIENHKDNCRVILSGEVTIYSAARIMGQLLDVIHKNRALEIDLADVGDFDSAGLQLLALAKREADVLGKAIHFRRHSASVREVLNLCDLNELFEACTVG